MFYVYVLKSDRDGKLYTGFTRNLEKRLLYHNAGLNASTKNRKPFRLLHQEAYKSETQARRRERFLKSGKGRENLKNILENT